MFKTFARAGLLAAAAMFGAMSGASAGMQMPGTAALLKGEGATPVTFWAQPYPYRYVPRHRCPLVRVETPYGWYWDRVCTPIAGPILRRAY